MRSYLAIFLWLLFLNGVLASEEKAKGKIETGAELSDADTVNYHDCAMEMNNRVGDLSCVSGFRAVQIPPNMDEATEVEVELTIIQLHEITDDQVFSVTAMVTFEWDDERLALTNSTKCWNSTAQFTCLTIRSLVWYPLWTISNGHGTVLLKEAWQFNPGILFTNGHVKWRVTFNFFTECPLNVQEFPFDVQQCSIDITSPHYGGSTFKYVADKDSVKAEKWYSLQSPLWKIIGRQVVTADEHSSYPYASFRLLIQRRPGFYTVALIMPIVVVNIITAYTFLLPAFQEEKTTTAGAAVVAYFYIELMFFDTVPMSSDNIPGLIIFLTFHTFIATGAYILECRLIRFAEEKQEEEEQVTLRAAGFMKKNNKVVPLDKAEEEKKKGPFDGMSPEYLNDWCLVGYLGVVLFTYIIFFIYLPVKAQVSRDDLLSTSYSAGVPLE